MSIGRAASNTLRVRDERIAAYHISIENDSDSFVLEVLGNDALTELNGVRLDKGERKTLAEGDLITLSHLAFRFTSDRREGLLGRLWVVRGVHRGKVFRVERPEITIGRAGDNDVQFPDLSVSRHHCRLRRNGKRWKIEDLRSTNGTLVSGVLLKKPAPLQHGDEVVTGYSKFVFQESNNPPINVNLEPVPLCN